MGIIKLIVIFVVVIMLDAYHFMDNAFIYKQACTCKFAVQINTVFAITFKS